MKNRLIVLLLALGSMAGYAQNKSFDVQVNTIITRKMNEYKLTGLAVGVVQNGQVIYSKGFGVTNIKTKAKVTKDHVFHVASVSKLFTAIAVMQLAEAGKLKLDDKLVKIAPQLKFSDQRVKDITIRQLLNHTAGLPDVGNYRWGRHHKGDKALEKDMLSKNFKLTYAPATKVYYSNLGYDVLGYVVQLASGQTFEAYVKQHILAKANMTNSDFRYYNTPKKLRVSPHTKSRMTGKVVLRKHYPYTREHAPSSTLNASIKELNLWMIRFLGDLSNNKSYQQMLKPSFKGNSHMGLGFQMGKIKGRKKVGHYGGDRGFRSYLMMVPEENLGLVILGNCDYKDDFRSEILHAIAQLILK